MIRAPTEAACGLARSVILDPRSATFVNASGSPIDSAPAWIRLGLATLLSTIGGGGMWSVVVVLPVVQAEFGVARGEAALPYTLTMIGFAFGGVLMGRLADRFGILVPLLIGGGALTAGYIASAYAASLWGFAIMHGLLIGTFGSSASFGPLLADISHWFVRRRGIAVAICASGNYLAGAIWPPVVQHFTNTLGWRQTYTGVGLFCGLTLPALAFMLRRRPPPVQQPSPGAPVGEPGAVAGLGLSPGVLQALLVMAGLACCVAMSMPQVHIVAYCADLGYGVARGAEMLSLMLGFGIVSRVLTGWIADRVGGVSTLLLGSTLQGVALVVYLIADGLTSLYLASILFG